MRTKARRVSIDDIKSKDTKSLLKCCKQIQSNIRENHWEQLHTKFQHESHAFWAIKQMTHWKDCPSRKIHNAKKSSLAWKNVFLNFYLWLQNILKIYLMPFHCFLFSMRCVSQHFICLHGVLLRFTSITVSRNCYKNVKPWRSPTFFLRSIS